MFNVIDYLFVRDVVANGLADGAHDKVRQLVGTVYNRPYRTFAGQNGEANDEDDLDYGTAGAGSPYQQFNARGQQRPSTLPPLTHQDENGFAGLDAPLN